MTIKEQIEDAKFLAENGRNVGALTVLMLAIAGSSKKAFPSGTRSLVNPKQKMKDCESFTLFLGGRLRKFVTGGAISPEIGESGIYIGFRGESHSLEYVLYKFYRCELVHESTLPDDVKFDDVRGRVKGIWIDTTDNQIILGAGLIDVLIDAVVYARVNGPEFGIEHYDLACRAPDESAFLASICKKYDMTRGRVEMLKHVVRNLSPSEINGSSDVEVQQQFQGLIESGVVAGGMVVGLKNRGILDERSRLLDSGVRVIREIAANYDLVRVA